MNRNKALIISRNSDGFLSRVLAHPAGRQKGINGAEEEKKMKAKKKKLKVENMKTNIFLLLLFIKNQII